MSPVYTIGPEAYYKIFFHAAKHPHKSVNGVLLGTQDQQRAVEIADAVPLLHHWTSLSPMMEIGLDLVFQYSESIGMKVIGYYQACERLDDTALAPVGEKVASKIKAQFEDAIAFVIDGDKLGTSEAALIPYSIAPSSVSWRPVQENLPPFTPGSTFRLAAADLPIQAVKFVQEQNLHFAFGDFDDHLEDVTIDWLRNKACLP